MKMLQLYISAFLLVSGWVQGQLPEGCTPLQDQILSTVNPSDLWGESAELADHTPPKRVGDWGTEFAKPTQHFAVNQATNNMVAIQLFPYSAFLTNEGVCYDAYTLDRWSVSERQETMEQQTPSEEGAPWNKITSMGTNMRQMVTGPDGNPKAQFTGRSGVRVGIASAGDPVWTGFGDMFANWQYTSLADPSSTMDVPMVRGSALLTHNFANANPIVTPFCLSSVNGQQVSYQCPTENPILDIGDGYIDESSCTGGELQIIVRVTKPLDDVTQVQWAATPSAQWPGGMTTCGDECTMSGDGKRVDIVMPASGEWSYAVNVIGRFVIPPNWTEEPETATCSLTNEIPSLRACDSEFCHSPTCGNGVGDFQLLIELDQPTTVTEVQLAVDTAESWIDASTSAPMIDCDSDGDFTCEVSPDGLSISYTKSLTSDNVKYAVNIIGRFVQPPGSWQEEPFEYTCGQATTTSAPGTGTTGPTLSPTTGAGSTTTPPAVDPSFCTDVPTLPPCPNRFCKYTFVEDAPDGVNKYLKIVTQYAEPLDDIGQVEVAFNTIDGWSTGNAMLPCTDEECFLSNGNTVLTYCKSLAPTGYAYAFNIIGRMIQPPSDWQNTPFWVQVGGEGTSVGTGSRFLLELDEPGSDFPDQTRKYVLYFSEEMTGVLDAEGLRFEPTSGGTFTGTMQMAYTGATPRGDQTGTDFFDAYQGTYSSSPLTSYCVEGDMGYLSFEWNPVGGGDLLMVTMPHQDLLLEASGVSLIDTPFTFKGLVGESWVLEYPLQPATMMPDAEAVAAIQANPEQLQDVLDGLDLDLDGYWIDDSCVTGGTYWAGKDIAMTARAASISRAFGTSHYTTFDTSLESCLNKWLRKDDSLNDGDKLRFESVWGGLMSRGVPDGEDFDPQANFGFPTYNDHHFHLGYWVYAFAYYAEHHPEWAQDVTEEMLFYVRDIANPTMADQYFPVARHKDFYIGHSWASGVAGGMRTQESSTESIAAYHGVAALGSALGNQAVEDFGRLLLAMEIHSVREYYHVREHNRHNFPPFIQEYGAIGMFSEEAIFMYTLYWPCNPNLFPARHACLVGIQVIPITAIAKYYMDTEWAASVNTVCQWSVDPTKALGAELVDPEQLIPVSFGWGTFCLAASAALNETVTEQAADYIRGKGPRDFESGTGAASTYVFLYGRT